MSYVGPRPLYPPTEGTALRTGASWSPAALLWVVACLAGSAGILAGLLATPPRMDAELVPLLRFMAVIKAATAIGAAALAHWRLRREAGLPLTVALVGSTALMMSAPGLIWGISHLVVAAVLFHAGLLVFLVAAARDGLGCKAWPGRS